ncbi:twin-arginine translocase subunit TatB [Sphingomonas sabuli]|uniref:Twin-arginine translocase subunit TatB n=1 Tax=Sphingomonas sabuli TaxID=2764186 RepID=A0A7G9L1P8_9SPHN|nr:Sec-independent protein translocase protein TatB [Sphingomonas sabuli]QNM82547.1 twin-arginine translocase subunit TatB [Sphingomonas sabuli]
MFGVDSTELIIIAVAALIFIGPKDLPAAMRTVGRWVGKVRGMARHFHSSVEAMMREAELEEMEKQWRAENERIMREYPMVEQGSSQAEAGGDPMLPLGQPDERPPMLDNPDEPPLPLDDTPPAPRSRDTTELP